MIVMRVQQDNRKALRIMTFIKPLIIANHNYYYYSTVKMDEVNQDVESFPMLVVKCFSFSFYKEAIFTNNYVTKIITML